MPGFVLLWTLNWSQFTLTKNENRNIFPLQLKQQSGQGLGQMLAARGWLERPQNKETVSVLDSPLVSALWAPAAPQWMLSNGLLEAGEAKEKAAGLRST